MGRQARVVFLLETAGPYFILPESSCEEKVCSGLLYSKKSEIFPDVTRTEREYRLPFLETNWRTANSLTQNYLGETRSYQFP